ncbi:hypothetical protein H1C71_039826, partial [Ictidomys tridecemlineatus]
TESSQRRRGLAPCERAHPPQETDSVQHQPPSLSGQEEQPSTWPHVWPHIQRCGPSEESDGAHQGVLCEIDHLHHLKVTFTTVSVVDHLPGNPSREKPLPPHLCPHPQEDAGQEAASRQIWLPPWSRHSRRGAEERLRRGPQS